MLDKTNFFSGILLKTVKMKTVGSLEKFQKAEIPVCLNSIDTSFTVTVGTYLLLRKQAAINPVYRELYSEERINGGKLRH